MPTMLDPFILRAFAAAIGVALIAGVIGCFVVWRKMAYFGDSLAHSALLGIALGLLYGLNLHLATILVCTGFAILLVILQQRKLLATDTLLGILAHAALSFGVVAISFLHTPNFDIHSYLFGDILTVTLSDLYWIYIGGTCVILLLIKQWSSLVLMTIHEDLAKAEGVRYMTNQLLLMGMMTLVVAVSIRITGILLITSMLIIPAATARQFARSPRGMAFLASGFGIIAVIIGILSSMKFDIPSGPSIVSASALLFAALFPLAFLFNRSRSRIYNRG